MRTLPTRALIAALTVVAALLVAPRNASAQIVDVVLTMDGVTGESTHDTHRGAMDVLSWSWGASTGTPTRGRGVAPSACIQDLVITKVIDLASPQLIMNGVTGAVAAEATLSMNRAGSYSRTDFLSLKMTNVTVQSYQTGGNTAENPLIEKVTLRFESLRGEYRRFKDGGGYEPAVSFAVGGSGCR